MESLDPRIQRLDSQDYRVKQAPDQLNTFEVFVQLREGKAFLHTGIVHASDTDMAFIFAKEQYTRRLTCTGLMVVDTAEMFVTEYTSADKNVLDQFTEVALEEGEAYAVYSLQKRGKQHQYMGDFTAKSPQGAIAAFQSASPDHFSYNIWTCKKSAILQNEESFHPAWDTLPDKGFRDAAAYKAGKKLKDFLANK